VKFLSIRNASRRAQSGACQHYRNIIDPSSSGVLLYSKLPLVTTRTEPIGPRGAVSLADVSMTHDEG